MVLSTHDIASKDALFWANLYKIRLPSGVFSIDGREYLKEFMQSDFKRKMAMKGTQGGATLAVILEIIHGMIHGLYPNGVLYLMPTADDVQDFSKTKFNPLIQKNPKIIGCFVHTQKGTDTASLKKISVPGKDDSFLYLRSASLPRKIEIGYSESSRLKGITVDVVVFDELDVLEDDTVFLKAKGRMAASKVKHEIYIGNPGTPNRGIDSFWQQSDQRHWFMVCKKCGTETCAELEFFDNPNFIKVRDDDTSFLGCKKCDNQIDNSTGHWIPDVPINSKFMHGYRWSQLIIPDSNPAEILHDFRYPPHDNIGDVYRTQLGLPWISSEDALTKHQVFECCGEAPQRDSHTGPCAMGVDVGDVKHIVIGGRTTASKYEIFKVCRLSSWDDIHDLAKRFNVKSSVIDLRPMADMARAFQKREKYKMYLCEYSESSPLGVMYNDNTGLVKVQRTEIFDRSGKIFRNGDIVIPRKSPEIIEFARQMTDPICVEEKDKRSGILVRRYRGNKDHYRNAMNYFCLAVDGGKIGMVRDKFRQRQTHAFNNYSRV